MLLLAPICQVHLLLVHCYEFYLSFRKFRLRHGLLRTSEVGGVLQTYWFCMNLSCLLENLRGTDHMVFPRTEPVVMGVSVSPLFFMVGVPC